MIKDRYEIGVLGYGLDGPMGETGDDGNNVYYSVYDSSSIISEYVKENKTLSNNTKYSGETVYNENDIILARNGMLFEVKLNSEGEKCVKSQGKFSSGSAQLDSAYCEITGITITDSSIANPYYKDSSYTVYKYMDEYKYSSINGRDVSVSLTVDSPIDLSTIKIYVTCGNGLRIGEKIISSIKSSQTAHIFVPNKSVLLGKTNSTGTINNYNDASSACGDFIDEEGYLHVECTTTNGIIYRYKRKM